MIKIHQAIRWGAERRAADVERALRAIGRRDLADLVARLDEALLAVLCDEETPQSKAA
jgi:hypothetical protein